MQYLQASSKLRSLVHEVLDSGAMTAPEIQETISEALHENEVTPLVERPPKKRLSDKIGW